MSNNAHILLVEDEAQTRDRLSQALALQGHQVSLAVDLAQAQAVLQERGFQLVVVNLTLPGGDCLELISYIQENWPHTPVIALSGPDALKITVEAMRRGAFDFHQKPVDLDHFLHTVERALEKAALHKAFDYLRHEQPYIYRLENILAHSQAMQQVLEQVAKVAPTDITVLLTGETGTGKSLIAGAIHANSPRAGHTLVTVNCAALTETLLESELFGHEKGAFTGAHKFRTGRFEQAHGGSLFLDEVGDMSPATQAKVLRAIEDKEVQRVGGSRIIKVDARILAATNVDLQRAVQEGRFRGDLFYRLNITPIHIPPLRQRREDLLPLAEMFLWRVCQESKRKLKPLSASARLALGTHTWPGNIRELRNVIERAVLFANGPEITPQDLGLAGPVSQPPAAPPSASAGGQSQPDTLDLEALEQWAILTALERSDWVQSRAASLLGISPRALSYKLDKLELSHPELAERRRRR